MFYRTLFIDHLMPLKVNRVLCMDSDEIVRENLLELYYADLGAKPIGMVPHCNANRSFMNSDYWIFQLKERGFTYHFGALVLANMPVLREGFYGDTLKSKYQKLMLDRSGESLVLMD